MLSSGIPTALAHFRAPIRERAALCEAVAPRWPSTILIRLGLKTPTPHSTQYSTPPRMLPKFPIGVGQRLPTSTYSPGETSFRPAALARIFSVIVFPIGVSVD